MTTRTYTSPATGVVCGRKHTMNLIPKGSAVGMAAVVLSFSLAVALSQTPLAAQGTAAGSQLKMEDVFRNITHLKGQPADQG